MYPANFTENWLWSSLFLDLRGFNLSITLKSYYFKQKKFHFEMLFGNFQDFNFEIIGQPTQRETRLKNVEESFEI